MPSLNDKQWPIGFLESITDEEAEKQLRDPRRWSYIVRDPNGMVCAFGRGRTPKECERWAIRHAVEHVGEVWPESKLRCGGQWRFVIWPPFTMQP